MNDQQTKENRLRGLINLRTLKVKCECGKLQSRYCPYGYCGGIGIVKHIYGLTGEYETERRCLCNPKVGDDYDNQE